MYAAPRGGKFILTNSRSAPCKDRMISVRLVFAGTSRGRAISNRHSSCRKRSGVNELSLFANNFHAQFFPKRSEVNVHRLILHIVVELFQIRAANRAVTEGQRVVETHIAINVGTRVENSTQRIFKPFLIMSPLVYQQIR